MNKKNKEVEIPLRRSELISPMGVGSICTNSDGVNLMPGALDLWFSDPTIKVNDFIVREERLERIFGVDEFRLPPDYRKTYSKWQHLTEFNLNLKVPVLRFPYWHYCSHCKIMSKQPSSKKDSKIECEHCKNPYARLIQVPLVIACEKGHIDDFPWSEWVHKTVHPSCNGPLKLIFTGGATLSTMEVQCTKCDKKRNLKGVTKKGSNSVHNDLSDNEKYYCTGKKPWFGPRFQENCECVPQPILKNNSNVYFPSTMSAIFLPPTGEYRLQKILDLFSRDDIKRKIELYLKFGTEKKELIIEVLKDTFPKELAEFNDLLLNKALDNFINHNIETCSEKSDIQLDIKIQEHKVLYEGLEEPSEYLKIVSEFDKKEDSILKNSFGISRINLVPVLRETRVLYGFSRLFGSSSIDEVSIEKGKYMLFKNPSKNDKQWLPAYTVHGEGIFFEFDDSLLTLWETSIEGSIRIQKLDERINDAVNRGVIINRSITPRYVMLHTLAHLFIQEIVLECGYSSSALKERIYVGETEDYNMNGFLIYTAAGDSEGTMGGLVRLGGKEHIERIFNKIISKATWCSSDPVCNEIGVESGQGRDYLNGAACHNCSYISEISCEEFNKYLDRGLIDIYEEDNIGFFEFLRRKSL
ncbi:DrmB family protein [Schinkia sp. CFF1]